MNRKVLLSTLLVCGLLLSACSSSNGSSSKGSDNSNSGDASSLQILTPKIIYSTSAVNSGYVTIFNNTESPISNLHYALTSAVGSGSNASIDNASATSCATLSAHTQCNLKVNIPAGSIAGSFSIKASNNSTQSSKLAQATSTVPTSLPVGIEQAAYNTVSGADGITLSYYNTVINGVPYILVSGVVASSKAGSFNNIVLVDSKNNPLPNQTRISGNISSNQGSSFMILLPVPSTSGASQTIKVQTQQVATDGTITPVSTAKASSTLTTTSGVGIANMLPGAVYLTENNPEQVITFSNSGDALATLQSLVATNPNMEVIFSPSSLASGAYSTATLKLKNPKATGTSGAVTLSYNNGQTDTKTSAVTEENVNPQPSPGPTPTPTPPPGPTPATAGLVTSLTSPQFYTSTAIGTVSQTMTLHNSGNTTENNFVFTLPSGFSIAAGATGAGDCTNVDAVTKTVSDTLPANGGECLLSVTYSNSSVVNPALTGAISIAYDYNTTSTPTPAPTPASVAVSYKITQSTANLSISPSTTNFTNIYNNNNEFNTQSVTIMNTGELDATVTTPFSFEKAGSALTGVFTSSGACTTLPSNTLSHGAQCQLDLKFGPTSTAGDYIGSTLNVPYTYTDATGSPNAQSTLNGTVLVAGSANVALGTTPSAHTGFLGGPGTNVNNAYQIESSTTPSLPTISYTITNSGAVPANNFYIGGTAPAGYAVSGTCGTSGSPIVLSANNGTCTLTYQLISNATVAPQNLDLTGGNMNWYDQAHPTTLQTTPLTGLVYVNVYASAGIAITTTPSSSISVEPGGSFTITATLTGGYNITAQTIHATTTTSDVTFTNNDCAISSSAGLGSCTITVNVGASAAVAAGNTITISNSTTPTPAATPAPSTVNFDIAVAPAVVQIALPQTGQMNQVPSMCSPLSASCINSPVGSDGYGYASGPYNIPYGVTWAYNGYTNLVPLVRFTSGNAADGSACPSGQLVESDNLTGLMWQQNPSTTTYKWQDSTVTPNTYPALAAVENLNSGSGYCGYTDWRLPNINELVSMLNLGQKVPYIWLNTSGFPGVGNFSYWSSTTMVAGSGSSAWVVMLDNTGYGRIATQGKTSFTAPIWAVRGNSATSTAPAKIPQTGQTTSYAAGDDGALQAGTAGTNVSGRFKSGTLLEADCITDSQTGLMWPKNGIIGFTATSGGSLISQPNYSNTDPDLNSITWYDALTAMTKMNTATTKLCGYSDWRLPNFAELRSLINYGQVNYSISSNWLNDQGFSGVQNKKYWTSTIFASTPSSTMWLIDMGIGEASFNGGQYNPYPVLPVRGGGAAGS